MSKVKETFVTIVRATDGEDVWEVFTERETHKKQFTKMFGEPTRTRGIGATWIVPLKDLAIRKRVKRTVTLEQREAMAGRMRSLRFKGELGRPGV